MWILFSKMSQGHTVFGTLLSIWLIMIVLQFVSAVDLKLKMPEK